MKKIRLIKKKAVINTISSRGPCPSQGRPIVDITVRVTALRRGPLGDRLAKHSARDEKTVHHFTRLRLVKRAVAWKMLSSLLCPYEPHASCVCGILLFHRLGRLPSILREPPKFSTRAVSLSALRQCAFFWPWETVQE